MPAECGGAAGRDRVKRSVLDRRETVRATIPIAVHPHNVCELQSRKDARACRAGWHGAHRSLLPRWSKPLEQIERGVGPHFRMARQLNVATRRVEVLVPEQALNRGEVDAGFEQVRRERMAQRILTLLMNRLPPSFTTVTTPSTANT